VTDVIEHSELAMAVAQLHGADPAGNLFLVPFVPDQVGMKVLGTIPVRLPDWADPGYTVRSVAKACGMLRQDPWQDTAMCAIIAYAPAWQADPSIQLLRDTLAAQDMPVLDVLRVHDGRCWSYECPDDDCGPAGPGMPVDPVSDTAIRIATEIGQANA
jgi:hypothetical protein